MTEKQLIKILKRLKRRSLTRKELLSRYGANNTDYIFSSGYFSHNLVAPDGQGGFTESPDDTATTSDTGVDKIDEYQKWLQTRYEARIAIVISVIALVASLYKMFLH
jgi:hypothetical protein